MSKMIFELSISSSKNIKGHTEYQFIIISNIPELNNTYTRIYKRFSQIHKLHKKIYKAFPKLPDFPKKVWFGKMDPIVIENRRKMFEAYFSYVFDFILKNNLKEEKFSSEVFSFFNKSF